MNDSHDVPTLPQGERVEVRQREKGLRGSWHPATVVGLKPGRRLVEYDELLTNDGLHKLRECVQLIKGTDRMRASASRSTFSSARKIDTLKCSMSPEPRQQSRLRPVPPPCMESSPHTWQRGFWVDVFFQDAWWEAVLLDDVTSVNEDTLINVMYPGEGDQEKVCAKDVRISQEWDEATGEWRIKGKCNMSQLLKRTGLGRKKVGLTLDGKGEHRVSESLPFSLKTKDQEAGVDMSCSSSSVTPEITQETDILVDESERGLRDNLDCKGSRCMPNGHVSLYACDVEVATATSHGTLTKTDRAKSFSEGVFPLAKAEHDAAGSPSCALRHGTSKPLDSYKLFSEGVLPLAKAVCSAAGSPSHALVGAVFADDKERVCCNGVDVAEMSFPPLDSNIVTASDVAAFPTNIFMSENTGLVGTQDTGVCSDHIINAKLPSSNDNVDETTLLKSCKGSDKGGKNEEGANDLNSTEVAANKDKVGQDMKSTESPTLNSKTGSGKSPAVTDGVPTRVLRINTLRTRDTHKRLDYKKEPRKKPGTLSSFKERLVQKKRMQALRQKAALNGSKAKKDDGLHAPKSSHRPVKGEGTSTSSEKDANHEKKTLKTAVLKNLVREISKKALLEAGFKIELRERRNKDYKDSVYISPQGHTYWSVPNAWRALKQNQLKPQSSVAGAATSSSLYSKATPSAVSKQKITPSLNGGKGNPSHWKIRVTDRRQEGAGGGRAKFTRVDLDTLLASAAEKAGGIPLEQLDLLRDDQKLQLTNVQLVDFLLEDLRVLKRVTGKTKKSAKKHKKEQRSAKRNDSGVSSKASRSSFVTDASKTQDKKRKGDRQLLESKAERGKRHKQDELTLEEKSVASHRSARNREQPELLSASGRTEHPKRAPMLRRGKSTTSANFAVNQNSTPSGHLDDTNYLRKPDRYGEKGKRDSVQEDLEDYLLAKRSRTTSRERSSITKTTSKRQRVSSEDDRLEYSKAKKCKLSDSEQAGLHKKKRKDYKPRSGFRLEVRAGTSRKSDAEQLLHDIKQTVFSWMIDRGVITEKERLCYVDQTNNRVLKEGIVTREGILCRCCKKIFTSTLLDMHAGGHTKGIERRIIFTSGKSLLDCQIEAWRLEKQLRKIHNYVGVSSQDRNDDTCILCGDGGDLLCCDHCPSTYHTSCLQIQDIPEGDWFCPKCQCSVCGSSQDKTSSTNSMLLCAQCEHRYHVACLHGKQLAVQSTMFCGEHCKKIYSDLTKLIGITHTLENGLSWSLLRCEERDWSTAEDVDFLADYHCKLAVALRVMEECFVPMDDPRTNINMIAHTLYNRWSEFDRLNYKGFYTVILERGGEIISVASIRVHGARLAEMPLIGTREQYRRQGMCRLLVGVIEKLLSSLEIATFVLPAIPELLETWTHAFGFKPLDSSQKLEYRDISMMMFPGTQLLHKPWLEFSRAVVPRTDSNDVAAGGADRKETEGLSIQDPESVLCANKEKVICGSEEQDHAVHSAAAGTIKVEAPEPSSTLPSSAALRGERTQPVWCSEAEKNCISEAVGSTSQDPINADSSSQITEPIWSSEADENCPPEAVAAVPRKDSNDVAAGSAVRKETGGLSIQDPESVLCANTEKVTCGSEEQDHAVQSTAAGTIKVEVPEPLNTLPSSAALRDEIAQPVWCLEAERNCIPEAVASTSQDPTNAHLSSQITEPICPSEADENCSPEAVASLSQDPRNADLNSQINADLSFQIPQPIWSSEAKENCPRVAVASSSSDSLTADLSSQLTQGVLCSGYCETDNKYLKDVYPSEEVHSDLVSPGPRFEELKPVLSSDRLRDCLETAEEVNNVPADQQLFTGDKTAPSLLTNITDSTTNFGTESHISPVPSPENQDLQATEVLL